MYSCDTPPPKKKGGVAVHINVVFDILVDQNGGRKFWQVSSHREIAWSGLVMVGCAFRDLIGAFNDFETFDFWGIQNSMIGFY